MGGGTSSVKTGRSRAMVASPPRSRSSSLPSTCATAAVHCQGAR